jgi:hypothetical protein
LEAAYDIAPGSFAPRVNEMTDFNMWTWNARVFPGIDPLPCAPGTGLVFVSVTLL